MECLGEDAGVLGARPLVRRDPEDRRRHRAPLPPAGALGRQQCAAEPAWWTFSGGGRLGWGGGKWRERPRCLPNSATLYVESSWKQIPHEALTVLC